MSKQFDEIGQKIKNKFQESKDSEVFLGSVALRQLFWKLESTKQTRILFDLMDSVKENLPSLFGK